MEKLRLIQEKKQAYRYEERLDVMQNIIKTVRPQAREFDKDLVNRLIDTIKVNRRERLEIKFE